MARYFIAELSFDDENRMMMERVIDPKSIEPVVHAQWTRKRTQAHDGELYCSNCEWTPEVLGATTIYDLLLADVYRCPHCGAKMDRKKEG